MSSATQDAPAAAVLRAQAAYYGVTGVWPLLDMRSFQWVTGPKASPWLVKTFGAAIGVVGATLASAERGNRVNRDIALLSIGSALALGVLDVRYAVSGRISKIYLVDAAAQALILAGWARAARS